MFIDTHAHIHVKNFDSDRDEVIQRALASNVKKIINVGFDVEENFRAIALSNQYEFIYAALGVHPHLASQWNDQVGAGIVQLVKKERKIVALGETGLDYYKNFQPVELQKNVFRAQAKLAKELQLPLIIHCRDAFGDVLQILKEEKIDRAVFHCFTGQIEEARQVWELGFYTGFTAIITYKSAENLRKIVDQCPVDRMLLETDCPYLAPQNLRGRRNEPANVSAVYNEVACFKKKTNADLEREIEQNVKNFFKL